MTRERTESAPSAAPPFARPMAVGRLSRKGPTGFALEAEAAELEALAGFLGVARVDRLAFEGSIAPAGEEGWQVQGRLVATLEQTCVVTLDPVPVSHEAALERLYLPAERLPPVREVAVAPDEADEPDPFTTTIDPGLMALENLALMLDPYPRAAGAALGEAAFAPPGAEPIEDAELRPFAGLAALKDRLDRGGG